MSHNLLRVTVCTEWPGGGPNQAAVRSRKGGQKPGRAARCPSRSAARRRNRIAEADNPRAREDPAKCGAPSSRCNACHRKHPWGGTCCHLREKSNCPELRQLWSVHARKRSTSFGLRLRCARARAPVCCWAAHGAVDDRTSAQRHIYGPMRIFELR